jgi:hypothetical protein
MIQETINLLGLKAKDKVSNFEGVISSIHFDLYGCVQCVLAPAVSKDGKLEDSRYFDVNRLDVGTERVMNVPDFVAMATKPSEFKHGPAEKPYQENKMW